MATSKEIKLIITAILNNKQFKAELAKTNAGMKKTAGTATTLKTTVAGIFTGLGLTLGIGAFVTALRGAIKVQMEFEQAAKNAAAVSGVAFADIARVAREAGARTQFTAKESADALVELARAGLTTANQMEKALTPALRLATVGQLGLAEASNKMVNTIKQFRLNFDDATMVTDVLAKSANSATTTVGELSQALSFVGPVAGQLGISLKDTTNILAQLANIGVKGTRAGTALRMALSRLGAGIPAVTKTLKQYGITQEQVTESLKDPRKLFDLLAPAMGNTADATKILGIRAQALIPIIQGGSKSFDEFQKKIDASKDAAQLEAEMLDTLEGQTKLLKSAWQELILAFGDTGALKELVRTLRQAVIWVISITKAFNNAANAQNDFNIQANKSVRDQAELARAIKRRIIQVKQLIREGVNEGKNRIWLAKLEKRLAMIRRGISRVDRLNSKDVAKDAIKLIKLIDKQTKKRIQLRKEGKKQRDEDVGKGQDAEVARFDKEIKAKEKAAKDSAIRLAEFRGETVNAEILREEQKFDQIFKLADEHNLSIEGLEELHQNNLVSIRARGAKRSIDVVASIASGVKSIADNIVQIERNKYNRIDENDKEARGAQAKRIISAWRASKALNTANVSFNTAAGIVSAFNPYIPFLSEARAIIVGGVGATQALAINTAPEPSFQVGSDFIPETMRARVHKGERIIPASMNIPGVSNADLIGAAVAGMRFASPGMASNTFNNQRVNNARSTSFPGATFNLPGISNPRQFLKWAQDEAGSMGTGILNR